MIDSNAYLLLGDTQLSVTFDTLPMSSGALLVGEFNEQLQAMRNWHASFEGNIDPDTMMDLADYFNSTMQMTWVVTSETYQRIRSLYRLSRLFRLPPRKLRKCQMRKFHARRKQEREVPHA